MYNSAALSLVPLPPRQLPLLPLLLTVVIVEIAKKAFVFVLSKREIQTRCLIELSGVNRFYSTMVSLTPEVSCDEANCGVGFSLVCSTVPVGQSITSHTKIAFSTLHVWLDHV